MGGEPSRLDLGAYCASRHPQVDATRVGRPSCGAGWDALVTTAVGRMAAVVATAPASRIVIEQVTQKYGTLRFYWYGVGLTRRQHRRIDIVESLAEERSGCICETCGAPAYIRVSESGNVHTACDAHSDDPPEEGTTPREFTVTRPISRRRRISEGMTYDYERDRLVVLSRRTETSAHWKRKRLEVRLED